MNTRLIKLERDLDALPAKLKEDCQREVQESLQFIQSAGLKEQQPPTKEKDKKKPKSIKFREQETEEQQPVSSARLLESLREEFNLKMQLLVEELQNTVSLKDFEKKCLYFEDKISLLKLLPQQASGPELSRCEDAQLANRLDRVEESVRRLKASLEQLLAMVETDRVLPRSAAREPQDRDSRQPRDRPPLPANKQPSSLEDNHPLDLEEIENFDVLASSQDSLRDRSLKGERRPPRKQPATSSSAGKTAKPAVRPAKPDPCTAPAQKDRGHCADMPLNDTVKYKSTKDKIRSLLGKSGKVKKSAGVTA